MRTRLLIFAAALLVLGAVALPASGSISRDVEWRHSTAVGEPWDGKLVDGVRLPREGEHYFTWDPATDVVPNEPWRRWGTDRLLHKLLRVIRAYSAEHPNAPRVGVGDISRRHGGSFGAEYGGLGHVSHQNGLDVDVYYPRVDRRELAPMRPRQVDRRLAQDLVDRFVAAGAEYVFVGPNVDLEGPPDVVQELKHHNDHLHFRIPNRGER